MNDPYRRRSPDGFDDDAIFADIVAHLNDDATEAEQTAPPAAANAATDAQATDAQATDVETTDASTEESTAEETVTESSAETPTGSTDLPPAERPQAGPNQWHINPPPWLPVHNQPEADPQTDPEADPQSVPAPQLWRAHEVDDELEEHFEPPPVTPLPAGDLAFWAIIIGMCGGPLLLLYLVFFNRDASSYWILSAIAMSVGGFVLLVSRMPGHHEDDDDGARL